jgi:hypothetical protein
MGDVEEVYQELYTSNNSYFFRDDGNKNNIPFFISIGIMGKPFEEDLVIPVTKDYLKNLTLKKLLDDQIVDKNENAILESLQLGNIIDFDKKLNRELKNTFYSLKSLITDPSEDKEIYSEPLNFGKLETKGHLIKEKRVELNELVLLNLVYIEINSQTEGYNNIKQYIARFKIYSYNKKTKTVEKNNRIVSSSKQQFIFGPFKTPVIGYTMNKYDMMRMSVVKKRIDERKKWLQEYSDEDILFLIFSPIRFLRFKHMQNRLTRDYVEEDKEKTVMTVIRSGKGTKTTKPSIVNDIKRNVLLDSIWEYDDLEYLLQIDLLVENGIIVPTDFNYSSPPYAIVYKVIKDGILTIRDIEHHFKSPKVNQEGHFITYMCNKKMGKDGTQVLIKYRDELGNTNKTLTCAEMDEQQSAVR